ncbi:MULTISPECIES: hypothetical protein [Halomonadaceae]|uniref:hypothetical protein n=1 Tax=Halomonadaceae TaxID=28256 RepID=UPI0015999BE9|nr:MULTISPECIES: hypothetical protein [Halomonas]QJQ96554.1 hypothetical protein HIO72_15615 [Halomonas sp. PA5]
MFDWLKPAKLPTLWAIKQIDDHVLHLCGKAQVEGNPRVRETLVALEREQFRGPIRMLNSGLILNAGLFEALIPLADIESGGLDHARWKGKHFQVSWVPQKMWTYTGRFTTEPVMINGEPGLGSVEDVSAIRSKASRTEQPPATIINSTFSLTPKDSPEQHSEQWRKSK